MRHRWIGLVSFVWAGAVLLVASTSGFSQTHRTVWGFFHETVGLAPGAADFATTVVRKTFHVPAYALVGALLWWAFPLRNRKMWWVLLAALVLAVTDEVIQGFHPQRTGRPLDVAVDLFGAWLGILVARRFLRGRGPTRARPVGPPAHPSPAPGPRSEDD